MPLNIIRGCIATALMLTGITVSAFHYPPDKGKMRLLAITTSTDKTLISYNADKSVSELLTIYKTAEGSYTTTRIPVYKNGKLVKTYVTDDESSHAPTLFAAYEYADKGNIRRIVYYLHGQVHGYDSLAYNNTGKITARYSFIETQDGIAFENNSCQHYTWDNKGNIVQIENMGRVNRKLPFTLSSTTTYTYDNHPNAQQSIPVLAYMVDIAAVNLSANNIVTETITPVTGNGNIVNRYTYAYNEAAYPRQITTTYAAGGESIITELEWTW
ncbi:hypothetical protein [Chitinophaga rhizophila]|uniref:YD repeat-containing protein n=1 Tax=Chitinophaga rhizophila TaxID=2866212 RepID=A0ABS7GJD9_9BACT|nr:hypothetical protein [Chitinophaga rhizophila]MBW8687820.1 hypothetical protein [Chitinophaga rhizophila]